MPVKNLVNTKLVPQDLSDITAALAVLEAKLPAGPGLSPEQRQAYPKMGPYGNDFVRDVLIAADQNPRLIPEAIDINAAHLDYQLVEDLTPILAQLVRLTERVSDTILEAGSEAFVASLEAYDILKRLGKGTNLDEALKKMSRRFVKQARDSQVPETADPAA